MGKFTKKGQKETPAVSTASLPDIVFMLLFFFMVTTVMREVDPKVEVVPPEASEIQKIEDKSLVYYIYIGEPVDDEQFGTTSRIQLNDDFATKDDIAVFVEIKRSEVPEVLVPKLTASLKVDMETQMGIVTDVKQELREVNALKINYATREGEGFQ